MTIKEIMTEYNEKKKYISKEGKALSEMEVVSLYKRKYGCLRTTSCNKRKVKTSEIIDEMIQMGEIKRR